MASMLLTRRLACSFQHNCRLLVPGKLGGGRRGGTMGGAVAGGMIKPRDSGDKGTGQPVLPGLSHHPHKTVPITP